MSTGEIVLAVFAILIPLSIAIAVTLWTLQPAVLRAERAKRSRKRASQHETPPDSAPEQTSSTLPSE